MNSLEELHRFQNELLLCLEKISDGEGARRRLLEHPSSAPFLNYVKKFSPSMLDLASDLTRQWGQRMEEK